MRIGKFILGGFLLAFALSILAKLVFVATIGAIAAGIIFMVAHKIKRWKYEHYLGYDDSYHRVPIWENMHPSYDRSRIMAQPLDAAIKNRYKHHVEQPYAYRTIEVL